MTRLRFLSALLAALVAAAAAFAGLAATLNDDPLVIDGLDAPRGLFPLPDGGLLIAEGGGRIRKFTSDGRLLTLAGNLRAVTGNFNEGVYTVGPSGVAQSPDGAVYFVVGEYRDKGFREAYRLEPNGQPTPLTGQDPTGLEPPNLLTNPYDLAVEPDGSLLVSDAGWNSILRVSPAGEVTTYAPLGPLPAGSAQAVPTGLARGPDGALYVATLSGLPHPPRGAVVFRVQDANNDNDATDPGETTIYADGFTSATDAAFDADGSLLVTEFSNNLSALAERGYQHAAELPGRLVRWSPDGVEVVRGGLVSPTSVAVASDGRVFVSEEFANRVAQIGAAGPSPLAIAAASATIGAAAGMVVLAAAARRQRRIPRAGAG